MKKLLFFLLLPLIAMGQGKPILDGVKLIPQTAPLIPIAGELWVSDVDNHIYQYDGTQWIDLTQGDGEGSDGVISNVALNFESLDFTGTNGGFNGSINLGAFNQTLSIVGNSILISGGNSLDLSSAYALTADLLGLLPLDGSRAMTGNLDFDNFSPTNVNRVLYEDEDTGLFDWSSGIVDGTDTFTNLYDADFAFSVTDGGLRRDRFIPRSGTATEDRHLIQKSELDAAIAGVSGSGDLWSDPVNSNILPDATGTRDLGAGANRFNRAYLDNLTVVNNFIMGGGEVSNDLQVGGSISMLGGGRLIGLGNGVNPTDGVNKGQLDAAIAGVSGGSGVTTGTKGDINVVGSDTDWRVNTLNAAIENGYLRYTSSGLVWGTNTAGNFEVDVTNFDGALSSLLANASIQEALDVLDDTSAGVAGTISGRTGTTVTGVIQQTEAQLIADGDPSTGEVVFCSDCAPAETVTASTLEVNDYKAYDDRATDAATFTFSNLKVGSTVMIEIDRATDATYSGVTVAYNEGTFAADTRQLVIIFVLPSGDVWRKYKTIE